MEHQLYAAGMRVGLWSESRLYPHEFLFADLVIARDLDTGEDLLLLGRRCLDRILGNEYDGEAIRVIVVGFRGQESFNRLRGLVRAVRGELNRTDLETLELAKPVDCYLPPCGYGENDSRAFVPVVRCG